MSYAEEKSSGDLLNSLIIEAIQDVKGKNIVKLDLRHISDAPVDYFIVCEGESSTQVKAISDNISKKVKEELDTRPSFVEGTSQAHWVLVDYFDTVVHVFHPETRAYYQLEDLWNDAKTTQYQSL